MNMRGGFGQPGPRTYQQISLKDQILGIEVPFWILIARRLLGWIVIFGMVLMAGEQLPTWIAVSVAFYLWSERRTDKRRDGKMVTPMLFAAVILCAFASFGYWPTLLQWQRVEYGWAYRVVWGASWAGWFWGRLAVDTGWLQMEWGVAVLRVFSTIIVPLIVWSPGRIADWALGIEIFSPTWRESMRSAVIDPASMPMPDGHEPRALTRKQAEAQAEETHVPAPPRPRFDGS
jgi:hypothetical protein